MNGINEWRIKAKGVGKGKERFKFEVKIVEVKWDQLESYQREDKETVLTKSNM